MTTHRSNPLVEWLSPYELLDSWQRQALERVQDFLDALTKEIEAPKRGCPSVGFARLPVVLPPPLRERAEALFFQLWDTKILGKQRALLDLLRLIGFTADPASIPFWRQAAALSRVRDQIAADRRDLVAAGLALTAARHPASGAFDALEALTRDPHVDARTSAVDALATLASAIEGPIAEASLEVLRRVATDRGAFAPRFLALRFLVLTGEPLPPYTLENAIAFEVSLGKLRRTIELRADQTLADLLDAILAAFGWDHDHLHQFALNGDLRDSRFAVPSLEEMGPPDEETPEEASFPLGAMDLPAGHSMALLYDLGDSNVFQIKVAGTGPRAARAKYPRVTAKVGKDPPQYRSW